MQQKITTGISILALVVAAISLWISYGSQVDNRANETYSRIVEFEVKKQEILREMIRGVILISRLEEAEREILQYTLPPELQEAVVDILINLRNTKIGMGDILDDLDDLPALTDTDNRVRLERVGSNQLQTNADLEELLANVAELRAQADAILEK